MDTCSSLAMAMALAMTAVTTSCGGGTTTSGTPQRSPHNQPAAPPSAARPAPATPDPEASTPAMPRTESATEPGDGPPSVGDHWAMIGEQFCLRVNHCASAPQHNVDKCVADFVAMVCAQVNCDQPSRFDVTGQGWQDCKNNVHAVPCDKLKANLPIDCPIMRP
ncbi:MAG: hypothetical protein MJE77_24860 [Proteobacteria bacterium]|nr:hypothetical protein [Pseudomonadota bacterium]